jgi:hypothetical protein
MSNEDIIIVSEANHADRDHSRFGPSSLYRIVNCPFSGFQVDQFPPSESSKYSDEGTTAHEIAELFLEAKLEGLPYPKVDTEVYNPEMIKCAKAYAEYIYDKIFMFLDNDHFWAIEKRLIGDADRGIWGTCDFIFIYLDDDRHLHLIIVDYKYGVMEVGLEEDGKAQNTKGRWQVAGYALGARTEFAVSKQMIDVEGHIFQPRLRKEDGEEVKPEVWKIDFKELDESYFKVIKAAIDLILGWEDAGEISKEDEQKYTRVGDHCQYCPKKGACNAYKEEKSGPIIEIFKKYKKAQTALKDKTKKGEKPVILGNKEYLQTAGLIDMEVLAFIALNKTDIVKFVEAAKSVAIEYIKKGKEVPGCKIVEVNANRKLITNEATLIKELKKLGVKDPTVTTTKVLGLGELDSLLGKEKVDTLVINKGEKSYKLVSDKHKAPAVEFGLKTSAMFKAAARRLKEK